MYLPENSHRFSSSLSPFLFASLSERPRVDLFEQPEELCNLSQKHLSVDYAEITKC